MAWIRDAVGLSLSAAALAAVSILATRFARPLVWFPQSPRGLQVDMAWIGDPVGMSLLAAALAVVSILAIYFACPLLFPHSPRGLRLEGAVPAEEKQEDEEEGYETAEEKNDDKEEGDEAAEAKTKEKEEDEERDIGEEEKKEDEEGGIAWILNALNSFQAYFNSRAPTPLPLNVSEKLDSLKLNDYVYELCKPSGRPSLEIVFFHGFQLGRSSETFATTWLSGDGSELWPKWITESFPEARILLVSYDGSATKKDDRGFTDMYVTRENLVQSLTDNDVQVGQDGCPVVLVGHSLGGLVIKEILLQANNVLSLDNPEQPNLRMQSFLENVKQLFFYSCPHHGTRFADGKTMLPRGLLYKLLTTLNKKASRRNEAFRQLRVKYKWRASSIAELLPTNLGSLRWQVIVEEASARNDTDGYYTAHADHFSICKPASRSDSRFSKLMDVIHCTVGKDVRGHQITVSATLVGLNDQINQIRRRLRTTKGLGICGIGGIGKSTLAKAVYNAISGEFEYTSFVSEVKKLVGEKVSIEDLQAEILKNLYYKGRKCEATSEARWNRLKGKKVLIILDDVEYESQVFVMPKTDTGVRFFSDGSCVLVTSRNKRMVSSKDFEVHAAQFLGNEASRKLFCCHAFKEEHAPGPYEDHVEKFIAKCGGLPLALEVAGKYLYKQKDKDMWNGAFQRLSAAQSLGGREKDPLWSIFEVIYQDLQEEEQQMFLDIATCFHGDKMEMANLVWRSCDWVTTANVGWQNLVDIGFVRADNSKTDDSKDIWMHELLRDFGRRKANPGSIESHSRVYCSEDSGELPPWPFKEGTTPKVKFLKIAVYDDLPIDIERLRGLENLKVLLLDGVTLYGAFNFLPDNLEVLIMTRCGWTARSSKSVSEAVDHYDMPRDGWYSTLGESSAPTSRQHVSLRHVDFFECHHFVPERGLYSDPLFPDHSFEHLPALKYLRISGDLKRRKTGSSGSVRIPDKVRELSALETLAIVDVGFIYLPETLGQLPALKQLDITCCQRSLSHLVPHCDPWGHVTYHRWDPFHPDYHSDQGDGWYNVIPSFPTRLPASLGQLQGLQKLAVRCETLRCLPDSLGQLRSLQELIIVCESLTRLPASLGQLQGLQTLAVSCESLQCLPDSLGQLRSLQKLIILCESLTRLPDSLWQLGDLQEMTISCRELTALTDNLVQLGRLVVLEIFACCSMRALPDTLGQLDGLRQLKIWWCNGLTALPDTLGQLDGLRELVIESCEGLTALPDNLGQLGGLRELKIRGCLRLTALPDTLGQLGGLVLLEISSCHKLTALPDTLGQLDGLRELKIESCSELTALPDNLGQLGGLRELKIRGCSGLTALPDTLGQLGGLVLLEIYGCNKLTALPDTLGQLDGLRELKIESCSRLTALPDTLGQLDGLRELKIYDCSGLTALPDTLGQLDGLRELKIKKCRGGA